MNWLNMDLLGGYLTRDVTRYWTKIIENIADKGGWGLQVCVGGGFECCFCKLLPVRVCVQLKMRSRLDMIAHRQEEEFFAISHTHKHLHYFCRSYYV